MSSFAVYDTVWQRYVGGVSSDESEQQTIADALTASTGRPHTVVEVEEDDNGGAGASPVADGVGSVFFGALESLAPFDNSVFTYTEFIASNDGDRAPRRDDLMVIEEEDATTINVVRSGLYDISLNVPLRIRDIVFDEETDATPTSPVDITAKLQVQVNGDNEPPAYDYNNSAYWSLYPDMPRPASIALNLTFPQVLEAGDTVRLALKATPNPPNEVTGNIEMNPDITFVLTYRGPVE